MQKTFILKRLQEYTRQYKVSFVFTGAESFYIY